MKQAVVIDGVRTPFGRAHAEKGLFRDVRADDLAAHAIRALIERTGIDPHEIEDVILGSLQQQGEQGFDVARNAALLAGLPVETGGLTVNRNCGSSLQALNQAAHAIMAGFEDVHVIGGVEHMHHIPMNKDFNPNPKLFRRTSRAAMNMGYTAEYLARKFQISRREQDEFAVLSHRNAEEAWRGGGLRREIVPTWGRSPDGQRVLADKDQCIRADTSVAVLADLKPAFVPEKGTVTAGNSSPMNDGACAMLVMSDEKAKALGLRPLVRIRSTAVAGVDPAVMGLGPVPASQKALQRAGLRLSDIDLIEINEAFAAQTISCIRQLGADPARVNVRGGAIAIGHPIGASGARIAMTLIHNMVATGAALGLATMCIGVGQGIATVFERCEN
ncbi:MAG: acetyl-CoA C-acyltransferase FadA [Phycisphaerae bacterium]|jgi:acetyl-CoA acyltransferase